MCAYYIIYYISFFVYNEGSSKSCLSSLSIKGFFRKPTSPPLNLKFFLKSTRPSFLIKRAALGNLKVNFHCAHWHSFFPLKKGPPLFPSPFLMEKVGCTRQYESKLSLRSFAQPFPSGYRGCANRPFNSLYDPFGSPCRGQKRSSNRYAIRLADHQRSTPVFYAGWDRREKTC